ncbi:DUF968 domain-containing protein [Azospirillum sp. sgz301742]
MSESCGTSQAYGGDQTRGRAVTVQRLQSLLAEANQRLSYGWLCCVIDRTGWLPLDHWYPERPHAPDTPHPVALSRDPADLVVGLEEYVRNFRRPAAGAPRVDGPPKRPTRDGTPPSHPDATPAVPSAAPISPPRCGTGPAPRLPPRLAKQRIGDESGPRRCPGHLAFVRGHACCVTGPECDGPIEAAHVRRGSGVGMGRKPDDNRAISLCRWHHQQQHAVGEAQFERLHGIDLEALAQAFARRSPSWQRFIMARQSR